MKQKGWMQLPAKWADKDGGGGEYIQNDYFHVKVNPQKIADLGDYELKTHRSKEQSLITLASLEPKDVSLHPLLLEYGFPYKDGETDQYKCRARKEGKICRHVKDGNPDGLCYPLDEVALNVDITGEKISHSPPNNWGFYLEINNTKKRVFVHFDSNRTAKDKKYQQWLEQLNTKNGLRDVDKKYSLSFDEIEKSAKEKFHKMVFIIYSEKTENGNKFIKIDDAYFLENFDFLKFLDALENGIVMYELRMHGNKKRISKNHGSAFRMYEKNFPAIYAKKESID